MVIYILTNNSFIANKHKEKYRKERKGKERKRKI